MSALTVGRTSDIAIIRQPVTCVPIGYSLRVNGREYRHAVDPSDVAAELREWSDVFFNKVRPSAEEFLRKGESGRLPHPEMGRFTVCPSCGQTVVFRAGEISETVARARR